METTSLFDPMKSPKLVGYDAYFNQLVHSYVKKIFPKVLLLSGKKGLGKFTLINHFLNYIFDKNNYDLKEKIIIDNSNFYSQQLSGVSQNFIHLKSESINNVKIDDIRNLKKLLLKKNFDDSNRFIILDDVERLSIKSSNALLKIIEEPPTNDYFILIDNQQNNLIETISSRCLKSKIYLKKEERNKIINYLIEKNNIPSIIDFVNNDITPGLFLKYNSMCNKHKITVELDFYEKINLLLLLYKKSKDMSYIDLSIFFTGIKFYNLGLKEKQNISKYNKIQIKIINCINDFVRYNLNLNTVFLSIKSLLKYAN